MLHCCRPVWGRAVLWERAISFLFFSFFFTEDGPAVIAGRIRLTDGG